MTDLTNDGGRDGAILWFLWRTAKPMATVALTFMGMLIITFLIGRMVPTDPVLTVVGGWPSHAVLSRVSIELDADRLFYTQVWIYGQKVLGSEFGESYVIKSSIAEDLARAFPATVELVTVAVLIGKLCGTPLRAGRRLGKENSSINSCKSLARLAIVHPSSGRASWWWMPARTGWATGAGQHRQRLCIYQQDGPDAAGHSGLGPNLTHFAPCCRKSSCLLGSRANSRWPISASWRRVSR